MHNYYPYFNQFIDFIILKHNVDFKIIMIIVVNFIKIEFIQFLRTSIHLNFKITLIINFIVGFNIALIDYFMMYLKLFWAINLKFFLTY